MSCVQYRRSLPLPMPGHDREYKCLGLSHQFTVSPHVTLGLHQVIPMDLTYYSLGSHLVYPVGILELGVRIWHSHTTIYCYYLFNNEYIIGPYCILEIQLTILYFINYLEFFLQDKKCVLSLII